MSTIIKRRTVLAGMAGTAALTTFGPSFAQDGEGTVHEVGMYTRDPENPRNLQVYIPALLAIQPGDTVRWLPENPGHNTESIPEMIPEGAENWKGDINRELEKTFTIPGVYGYKCTPHYAAGMVGLIIVQGEGVTDNLEAARSVEHRGRLAPQRFEEMFARAEEEGLLTTG